MAGVFWISSAQWNALAREETNAHRVGTTSSAWIERFGPDFLISAPREDDARALQVQLDAWLARHDIPARRIFFRCLVKQPGASDVPIQLAGPTDLPPEVDIRERALSARVDFSAGYSVGWFCDQRANREFLENTVRPAALLNCFAYTGAFSLAAARVGAVTTTVDLAKKACQRARVNFELNGFSTDGHRFLADDVFAVLPRMARRGLRFDAIILDPPTFSRGAGGRVFRATDMLEELLDLAVPLVNPNGWVLISTNAKGLDVEALRGIARRICPSASQTAVPPPLEYPVASASSTLWLRFDMH